MVHSVRKLTFIGAIAAALAAVPAAAATSPAAKADGEWLSLSGTVQRVSGDNFILDYGKNVITVEMDDYDWYNENVMKPGDHVMVTGRMDDDFLQARRIEASSVYVDGLHTRFFASPADEEDYVPVVSGAVASGGGITVIGRVQSIDGEMMIVDAGALDYRVDTGSLYYDPFDAAGFQHVSIGDRVEVSGRFDDSDFFDRAEIDAALLTELAV